MPQATPPPPPHGAPLQALPSSLQTGPRQVRDGARKSCCPGLGSAKHPRDLCLAGQKGGGTNWQHGVGGEQEGKGCSKVPLPAQKKDEPLLLGFPVPGTLQKMKGQAAPPARAARLPFCLGKRTHPGVGIPNPLP